MIDPIQSAQLELFIIDNCSAVFLLKPNNQRT